MPAAPGVAGRRPLLDVIGSIRGGPTRVAEHSHDYAADAPCDRNERRAPANGANAGKVKGIEQRLRDTLPAERLAKSFGVIPVEHHRAHLASVATAPRGR